MDIKAGRISAPVNGRFAVVRKIPDKTYEIYKHINRLFFISKLCTFYTLKVFQLIVMTELVSSGEVKVVSL